MGVNGGMISVNLRGCELLVRVIRKCEGGMFFVHIAQKVWDLRLNLKN